MRSSSSSTQLAWIRYQCLRRDLQQSELFQAPPLDPETAFRCYDQTLRHLLDQHAPLITKRVSLRQSVEWYDSECHAMKRTTRRLERQYRRQRSADTLSAWRTQFKAQRKLFQAKFSSYWLSAIDACRRNPRALWKTVNNLLQPPSQSATDRLRQVLCRGGCQDPRVHRCSSRASHHPKGRAAADRI